MCLVLAMVAWATTMDAPHGHGHPGDRVLVGRTLATYRGAGTVSRRHFQVSGPGNWGISWEFSCPAGQHGSFTIKTDDDDADGRERVSTSGSAGHGIYWYYSDPGSHLILVSSSCPWTVRVVLARPPDRHPGPSSPPASTTTGHGHRHKAARRAAKVKHRKPGRANKARHPKKRKHRKNRKHPKKAGHGK
jgi:hypothetical protein